MQSIHPVCSERHSCRSLSRARFRTFLDLGLVLLLLVVGASSVDSRAASLVVSEIMVQQSVHAFVDEDHDASDWIEIYNASDQTQNLLNWSLSDDADEPRKWVFPDVDLLSGQFLVVFASGKDYRDPNQALHTNFRLSSGGEALGLYDPDSQFVSGFTDEYPRQLEGTSYGFQQDGDFKKNDQTTFKYVIPENDEMDATWKRNNFDDTGWQDGVGGIGYDSNSGRVLLPLIDTNVQATMRSKNSTIYLRYPISVSAPDSVVKLKMHFDDGCVLYLNGRRVLTRNEPSSLRWNVRASGNRNDGEEMVPEFLTLSSRDGLRVGDNVLAVHGLNFRSTDRDFLFRIETEQWSQLGDFSIEPGFITDPSPGAPNVIVYADTLEKPVIESDSRVFDTTHSVAVTHPNPEASMRYTLDGSVPTERSNLYAGPILLESSAQLSVRAFHSSLAPSKIVQKAFIQVDAETMEFHSDVPVVLLDTMGERISASSRTSALIQLYDRGEDGRARVSQKPDFQGKASLKVRGSSTEGRPKKAYSMEIQDIYGNDRDVSLLGMPSDSDWILYAPYNFDRALMRNPFIYELSNQLGRYAVRTRFCEVYVNARGTALNDRAYVGVYVLMEKIKRGGDRVDIDKLLRRHTEEPEVSGGYILKIDRLDPGDVGFTGGGQQMAFVEPKEQEIQSDQRQFLVGFLNDMNRSLRDRDFTKAVPDYDAYIDQGAWIDFHILNEFTKNPDGFRLSTYMHLPRDGRLTFGPIWDFDRTMGPDDDGRAANPVGWSSVYRFGWWGSIFRNPNFAQAYIDRWQVLRQDVMSVENMHAVIDRMAEELTESAERNYAKWRLLGGVSAWQNEVRQLKTWVKSRAEWMDSRYTSPPRFQTESGVVSEDGMVRVRQAAGQTYYTVDGSDPRLPGGEISPNAKALSRGSLSLDIEGPTKVNMRSLEDDDWSGMVSGLFVTEDLPALAISEIMYHPAEDLIPFGYDEEDFEFVEIWNHGDERILLEGMTLSDAIDFTFPSYTLAPGEAVVVAADPKALLAHDQTLEGKVLGPFDGRLANGGEMIWLTDSEGRMLDQVQFDDEEAWPDAADGEGSSLERVRFDRADASAWRASSSVGGSAGSVVVEQTIPAAIQWAAGSIVRIQFEVEAGVASTLMSKSSLDDSEWKPLFRWEPSDRAESHQVELDTTGATRFFRIVTH